MKDIIKNIILENQNTNLPPIIKRRLQLPINPKMIVSLIGSRRSGKTWLMYDMINNLLGDGLEKEKVLFINFEDERLMFDTGSLDLIIQAYSELFPIFDFKDVYIFFDEIQNVPGWQKFVRRIFDTKTRNIFITGSNSKYLSTEIATELRGRTISYRVFPLSFSEYLDFNKVEKQMYPQKNKSTIIHFAEKFITQGGFPETVFLEGKLRLKILQEYFNVMIFRDMVERYQISNVDTLKFFIKKIFAGVTKPFSVNKAYNDLKSMGYKISNKYLYEYFNYCNDVFLCQSISRFNFSEIRQAKSDKKTYIIDNGMLAAIEFSTSENRGKLLENMVFLEFLKAEKEIFYFKGLYECDFVVREENNLLPVQVTWSLEDKNTMEREIKGLAEACDYLGVKVGTIISFDQEEEIEYYDYHFSVIPFYKYFLHF